MKIGFIGFGKMAKAIATGLAQEKKSQYSLYYYDIIPEANKDFSYTIQACSNIQELEKECDIIIFAVKPKDIKTVVQQCEVEEVENKKYYISIAAGISTKTIRLWNPRLTSLHLVRVMPNMGAFASHSVSAIYAQEESLLRYTQEIFNTIGITIPIYDENLMHAITGLSGSGPAYVLLFLQAMIEAGIREGLSYENSYQAALHTIMGTVKILQNQTTHPANWIPKITSPGGTTIEGLASLEKHGFKYAIYEAVHQATRKSKEISQRW